MAINPYLDEIQNLSPEAKGALGMAGFPTPANAPAPGMLLPQAAPDAEATRLVPRLVTAGNAPIINPPAPSPITMPQATPNLSTIPAPASTPALITGPNKGQAILSNGEQPSQLQMDTAERSRLLSEPSGIDQIAGKVENSRLGKAHPFLGKLLGYLGEGAAKIGDIGLTLAAPEIAAQVPGTELHHNLLLNEANRNLGTDIGNAQKEAQTENLNAEIPLKKAEAEEAQAKADATENPPEKEAPEEWTTLKLPTGDLLTGPNGKIIQQDKAGNLRAVDLPGGATLAPKQTAANSAFAQWVANPEKYEDFQKTMAEIKAEVAAEHPHQAANSSFMNIYAAQRFLQMAYTNNPAILPVASKLIGKLLNLSPDETAQLGSVPVGQPENEAGTPIGLHQPGAPTTATRNRGQFFESVEPSISDVEQQISNIGDQLGPAQGRWMELYEGKAGFNAPEYAGLRADLHNIATAWSRLHVNSAQSRTDFLKTLRTAQTPADLLAGLRSIQKQGEDYIKEGKGRPDELNRAGEPAVGDKGSVSLKAAMALPVNKGKSEDEVRRDITSHGYTVTQ